MVYRFNTDYNYMKRDSSAGVLSVSRGGSGSLAHTVGTIPYFEVHADLQADGRIWNNNLPYQGMGTTLGAPTPVAPMIDAYATTTSVNVSLSTHGSGGARDVYVIPYKDYAGLSADKFRYTSDTRMDKVLAHGQFSQVVAGPSGGSNYYSDTINTLTIPNPAQKRGLVYCVWSVDGTNFNSVTTSLEYSFQVDSAPVGGPLSSPQPATRAAIAAGATATDIQFRLLNGYHGTVTQTSFAPTYTLTGISQTFTVKWYLIEIDSGFKLNTDYGTLGNNDSYTGTFNVSGNIAAGTSTFTTTANLPTSPDLVAILFNAPNDNSGGSLAGRWYRTKNFVTNFGVFETTSSSWLVMKIDGYINGSSVILRATISNPYGITVALSTTTVSYKLVDYSFL